MPTNITGSPVRFMANYARNTKWAGTLKNDEPFNSNPNKEYIRSAVDAPVIEAWFRRLGRPLKYLGLPAWQMLDIVAWQRMLGRFTGIERAENQQYLMFLNANVKDLEHRLHGLYGSFDDILIRGRDTYQKSPDWPYDLINLDYFGGFLYSDLSRPKAFRKMVANQAAYEQSFILIVTQHLRDGDALKEKDKFLVDLGARLKGAALDSSDCAHVPSQTTAQAPTSHTLFDPVPPEAGLIIVFGGFGENFDEQHRVRENIAYCIGQNRFPQTTTTSG